MKKLHAAISAGALQIREFFFLLLGSRGPPAALASLGKFVLILFVLPLQAFREDKSSFALDASQCNVWHSDFLPSLRRLVYLA